MKTRSWTSILMIVMKANLLSGCVVVPKPISEQESRLAAQTNLKLVVADQEALRGPIDLYDAMARALKYNLSRRVESARRKLRITQLHLSHYSMLPGIVSNAGYAARNNFSASSSLNLATNRPNFSASTSQDKQLISSDLAFSWNILDFGLSYVRAQQAANKLLISQEIHRRVTHQLLEEVRDAFWRAASYQRLISRLKRLEARTQSALKNSRQVSKNREAYVLTALTYERELIEIKKTTKKLQRDIIDANSQLASLINVSPAKPLNLTIGAISPPPLRLSRRPDEMVLEAVQQRSELRENIYEQRINIQEASAALLELLPGMQVYAGTNFDNNSFLLNENWVSWGAKTTWHLLKVFRYPAIKNTVEAEGAVLKAKSLALTMSIMSQVYVSVARFRHFQAEMAEAAEYRSIQRRLLKHMRNAFAAKRVSEQALLREELKAIVAEAEFDISLARLQSAHAKVQTSIGRDLHAGVDQDRPISEISASLRQSWTEAINPPWTVTTTVKSGWQIRNVSGNKRG